MLQVDDSTINQKKKPEIQNHFISQFNFPSVSGRTISLKSREISLKKRMDIFFQ